MTFDEERFYGQLYIMLAECAERKARPDGHPDLSKEDRTMCDNKKTIDQLRKEIQEADEALERSRLELELARKRRELAALRARLTKQSHQPWPSPEFGGPYYEGVPVTSRTSQSAVFVDWFNPVTW